MNITDAFPSKYLTAADLGETEPVVTIDHVDTEPVGRNEEMKPVVYFKGKKKGLVLNKTNFKKIGELAGSMETDEWGDVKVKLYATEVDFEGKTVEAIRVKSPAPKPKPLPIVSDHDDEVPF